MPCDSKYCEADEREKESRLVCQHLTYLYTCLNQDIPEIIATASENYYGDIENLDKNTATLCDMIKNLSIKQSNKFVWNARDTKSRKLADWWYNHLEYDGQKEKIKQEEERKEKIKKRALLKLTKKEREALELD